MTTRIQHYVWREYLEAWQQGSGQIYCSRHGKAFKSTPTKVMRKRDNYSLSRITKTDVVFLAVIFRKAPPELQKAHRRLIESLGYIANANHAIQASEKATEEERKYANDLVIETEEKLQAGIEQRALPILEQLRREQTDFLSDYNLTMNFCQFVSHQYMRTMASRERVGEELRHSFPGWDFGHLKHLVCHCAAENIGASLFVDRSKFQIIFLRNGSKDEFITGDQPIVNLFRSHGEDSPPTELALYYPLNPRLSMILLPRLYGLSSMKVPPSIVDDLNNVIAQKAREVIVAKGIEAIQRTTDGLHEGQEQDGHMLLECIKRTAARADEFGKMRWRAWNRHALLCCNACTRDTARSGAWESWRMAG